MNFQTPPEVCDYMTNLVPRYNFWKRENGELIKSTLSEDRILEPTPGEGNLVNSLKKLKRQIISPDNFWDIPESEYFSSIVMNPPHLVQWKKVIKYYTDV